MFTPLYSSLTLPTSTQVNLLPSQFLVVPTLLMSTLVLLTLGLDLAKISKAINAHDSQGAMVA
ncbi:BQ5605_C002g01309 [Microbotryum silenes-dioicae]|uniref:BQ5605_C002g01309 protein n=1 Tax=Microbotryum silenes-dioicae TaxID=796604 RepID=A0A2X0P1I9_9BASI|nr:BQ5605_C002g01309 [Microbotryum silenes-dioicae]